MNSDKANIVECFERQFDVNEIVFRCIEGLFNKVTILENEVRILKEEREEKEV